MSSIEETLKNPEIARGILALAEVPSPSWRDPRTRLQHGLAVRITGLLKCVERGDEPSKYAVGIYLVLYVKLFGNSLPVVRSGQ